jgi:hypothetical protein
LRTSTPYPSQLPSTRCARKWRLSCLLLGWTGWCKFAVAGGKADCASSAPWLILTPLGRVGGRYQMETFAEAKTVIVNTG